MQVINGYESGFRITRTQQFRLYHLDRPAVKKWRATRHNHDFELDAVDQYIVKHYQGKDLVAVDCAGWYLKDFGVNTVCLEGHEISRQYYSNIYVEPDISSHRPTYIDQALPVFFKYPWFLKYATLEDFVKFLEVWTRSVVELAFDPIYIQHNHLKFDLCDLVRQQVDLKIDPVEKHLWKITK